MGSHCRPVRPRDVLQVRPFVSEPVPRRPHRGRCFSGLSDRSVELSELKAFGAEGGWDPVDDSWLEKGGLDGDAHGNRSVWKCRHSVG